MKSLGSVAREDKVAVFGGLVTGKARFVHCLAFGFAVGELSEPPPARRDLRAYPVH
jgi:hypothetical protein